MLYQIIHPACPYPYYTLLTSVALDLQCWGYTVRNVSDATRQRDPFSDRVSSRAYPPLVDIWIREGIKRSGERGRNKTRDRDRDRGVRSKRKRSKSRSRERSRSRDRSKSRNRSRDRNSDGDERDRAPLSLIEFLRGRF
jgi:hypothetical protein